MSDNMDKLQNNVLFQNKIVYFIKSILTSVDGGNFFRAPMRWVYALIGLLIAFFPFYLLFKGFSILKDANFWSGIVIVLAWLTLLVGGVVSFVMWWHRKDQIPEPEAECDGFPVTPLFAHFVRTLGEWIGFYVGVVMCLVQFILIALGGGDLKMILAYMGIGFASAITAPIMGFLIVITSRFVSEQIRALAAIAVNTKKTIDAPSSPAE